MPKLNGFGIALECQHIMPVENHKWRQEEDEEKKMKNNNKKKRLLQFGSYFMVSSLVDRSCLMLQPCRVICDSKTILVELVWPSQSCPQAVNPSKAMSQVVRSLQNCLTSHHDPCRVIVELEEASSLGCSQVVYSCSKLL